MAAECEDGGFCADNCGWHGSIAVFDDGEAGALPDDDVEGLVSVIEQLRASMIRARDHMLRMFPDGIKSQHADARQVFMALEKTDGLASNKPVTN
jgi:hypothetical protein